MHISQEPKQSSKARRRDGKQWMQISWKSNGLPCMTAMEFGQPSFSRAVPCDACGVTIPKRFPPSVSLPFIGINARCAGSAGRSVPATALRKGSIPSTAQNALGAENALRLARKAHLRCSENHARWTASAPSF